MINEMIPIPIIPKVTKLGEPNANNKIDEKVQQTEERAYFETN